jgi:hypothetical protein
MIASIIIAASAIYLALQITNLTNEIKKSNESNTNI